MLVTLIGALSAMGASEAEELRVVTSTTDLASLVQKVGCDLVDVTPLARYQHPHFVPGSALALLKLVSRF
jgi:ABC-type Zn uptake system ZnuABC Zn-binding protein ZnuA